MNDSKTERNKTVYSKDDSNADVVISTELCIQEIVVGLSAGWRYSLIYMIEKRLSGFAKRLMQEFKRRLLSTLPAIFSTAINRTLSCYEAQQRFHVSFS